MNLENFIEDYFEHIINGCGLKHCLYQGCLNCPDKNENLEKLRKNKDELSVYICELLERLEHPF